MNIKEFFKPDVGKGIVFGVIAISALAIGFTWTIPPSAFHRSIEPLSPVLMPSPYFLDKVPFGYFALWILYWYLISCIIVAAYKLVRSRK